MLARIATELSTVKSIVAEVETWQRKERSTEQKEYVAPRNPVEELLANIWQEVLALEKVGIYDNFFELGGNSLLATQAVSRIKATFLVEIPLSSMFNSPTVEQLSEEIEEAQQRESLESLPPIQPIDRSKPLPLSFAQTRLWFLEQLEGGTAAYNEGGAVRLSGNLNQEVLEQSFQEITRRHEILRTTFDTVAGSPIQKINPEAVVPISVVDWQEMPSAQQEEQLPKLAQSEQELAFDLSRGPLWRLKLVKLAPQDHILILTMHHIITDGWSFGILIKEFSNLYQSYSEGKSSPLPELSIQYADFAYWQQEYLMGEVLNKQMEYWKHQLAGLPPLIELPTDYPRPPLQSCL